MGGWSHISEDRFLEVRAAAEVARRNCEDHDPITQQHSVRVAHWAALLATRLTGFGASRIRRLEITAMLHDYGKTFVDPRVLNKQGPLDDWEWQEMRRHPELGIEHLPVPLEYVEPEGIRWHHKHYNGGGYPPGEIRGIDLSLEARIIACADVFDALTSRRPYRVDHPAFSPKEALEIMRGMAGSQLDPGLVSLFESVWQGESSRVGGEAGARTLQVMSVLGVELQRARDILRKIIGPHDPNRPLAGRTDGEQVLRDLVQRLEQTSLGRESAVNVARYVLRMPLAETFPPGTYAMVRGREGFVVGHHQEVRLLLNRPPKDVSYLRVVVYRGDLWVCISERTDRGVEARLSR